MSGRRGHSRRGTPTRAPRFRLDVSREPDTRERVGISIPRPSVPFAGHRGRFPFATDRAEPGHAFRPYGVQPTLLPFETVITDPRASRAILETLAIQHEALATLLRTFGHPPLPAITYVLGAPPLPPWFFFPPAGTPVFSRSPDAVTPVSPRPSTSPASAALRTPQAPAVDSPAVRRVLSPIGTPISASPSPVPTAQAASAQGIWRPVAQRPMSHLSSLWLLHGIADFDPETDDLLD